MSQYFLTNPNSPPSYNLTKEANGYFSFKENVAHELVCFGIPYDVAITSVIDLKTDVVKQFKTRRSPQDVAISLIPTIKEVYKVEELNPPKGK